MDATTFGTRPPPGIKRKRVENMPAGKAALAAGIPLVNLDECASIPVGLVLQLANELTPTDILNGLRQRGMFDHRLHAQTFDAYRLVLTNDAGREFVQEVLATVNDTCVNTRHLHAGLVAVLGAELFLGKT